MLAKQRTLKTLGLASRARKVLTGETLYENLKKNKVFLVFIAMDASVKSQKKIIDRCQYYDIPYINEFTINELSNSIGQHNRIAIGVTDLGLAKKLNTY